MLYLFALFSIGESKRRNFTKNESIIVKIVKMIAILSLSTPFVLLKHGSLTKEWTFPKNLTIRNLWEDAEILCEIQRHKIKCFTIKRKLQFKIRLSANTEIGKKRFPCLVFGLRCKLETSLTVIVACAVLHNICNENRDAMPPEDAEVSEVLANSIVAAETGSGEIDTQTGNENCAAIFKRNNFVQLIASL